MICALGLALAFTHAGAQSAGAVHIAFEQEYGDEADVQVADAWLPLSLCKHPAVILIHGGGWYGGERAALWPEATRLSAQGYAVFAIDYTLSGKDAPSFPKALDDVATAVRWVKGHRGVDGDKVVLLGESAGGHLALLYAYLYRDVAAVITVGAPADLAAYVASSQFSRQQVVRFLGQLSEEALWAASPGSYANAACPPVLMLHGGADAVVAPAVAERFRDELEAAGSPHRVWILPGADHLFQIEPYRRWRDEAVDTFIAYVLNCIEVDVPVRS
ncbi:MAG: alpha/beta hydrolase [Candidatus Hydrogenedentes bacterium]|nr:alpha/beta hydrolase [Candidatus Hydrogenedentota bacterium]